MIYIENFVFYNPNKFSYIVINRTHENSVESIDYFLIVLINDSM